MGDLPPLAGLSPQERLALASSPRASAAQLDSLAYDANSTIVRAALCNPRLPVKTMKRLALGSDKRWLLSSLWANPAIPEDVFRLLHLRRQTSGAEPADTLPYTHPNCPVDMLDAAAMSPHAKVRASVAGNPTTPKRTLRKLGADPSISVLAALASNPSTPLPTLDKLSRGTSSAVLVALVMRSDNYGRRLDAELMGHNSPRVRVAIARRTQDVHVLNRLALDAEPLVRGAVTRNPNASEAARVSVALFAPEH
jgi:hypothetical protein